MKYQISNIKWKLKAMPSVEHRYGHLGGGVIGLALMTGFPMSGFLLLIGLKRREWKSST